jgi:hypothetical protein
VVLTSVLGWNPARAILRSGSTRSTETGERVAVAFSVGGRRERRDFGQLLTLEDGRIRTMRDYRSGADARAAL